jgi:hypothetical protein
MKIKKETIRDISENFESFVESMEASDYVVWLELRKFSYDDGSGIVLANLREIFYNGINIQKYPIKGELIELDAHFALEEIEKKLTFLEHNNLDLNKVEIQNLTKERMLNFLNLIEKDFELKSTTKVFQHRAQAGSYFGDFIMWGFCIIFLNEQDQVGLVISGGASD